MKKLNEMSELEINNLTKEQVEKLIKLAKLENGIKLLEYPKTPLYEECEKPNVQTYKNPFFYSFNFTDKKELEEFNNFICNCKSVCRVDYNGNSNYKFTKSISIEDKTESEMVYDSETYRNIVEKIKSNSILKKQYDSLLSEYKENQSLSEDIVSEITTKVYDIKNKYYKLNNYCSLFKNDYMPLSENKEKTAIAFFEKAYDLSETDKLYILENYKTCKII